MTLFSIIRENREIVLKPEQEMATYSLLHGRDVMAILSTGFGKSMIITVFALAKEEMSSLKTCVILVLPLNSIMDNPISKMLLLSCTAMELNYDGNCNFSLVA